MQYEFSTRNTEDTLATMVEDAYVNHIPVVTGGSGRDELREFTYVGTSKRVILYERLGGIYSIATVVDDFIDRVMNDRD